MQALFQDQDKFETLSNQCPSPFILRGLKSSFGRNRTNDDVHSSISICSVTREVLDTPHMQRLRGLKQLGTSEMTYITTTHTRFEHSLGVASLAEKMVQQIKTHQPQLGITAKDVLCVKLSGLLHDLGHGPFSHVFDSEFRNQLKSAQEQGSWLGHAFNTNLYKNFPPVIEGWAHEDASLMMVDAILEYLGLQIDETNLDAPLKQIGHGIKAEYFGICEPLEEEEDGTTFYDGKTVLPSHRVLTSRDWIFIKECILGGPLPKKGLSIKVSQEQLANMISSNDIIEEGDYDFNEGMNDEISDHYVVGRPEPHKEWLYTIVANRFSGFDVDKLDYYARDARRAYSNAGGMIDPMFIENAVVAWGDCEPSTCLRCLFNQQRRYRRSYNSKRPAASTLDPPCETYVCGRHLMICFPEKMVFNAMEFFRERFKNHQNLYTHGNSKAVEYMICDVLLLADPWFRICVSHDGDGCEPTKSSSKSNLKPIESTVRLPISRCMTNPEAYLKLKDSVIDLISNTEDHNLLPARQLINRIRSRKLYKRIGKIEIFCEDGKDEFNFEWQRRLWDMPNSDVASGVIKCGNLQEGYGDDLTPEDIIVEKRQIHHGMKGDNPLKGMRFLRKFQLNGLRERIEDLPQATIVDEEEYWCVMPRAFLQKTGE